MNRKYIQAQCCLLLLFFCFPKLSLAKPTSVRELGYPALVQKFYAKHNGQLFWQGSSALSNELREVLLQKLDSSRFIGTNTELYHADRLRKYYSPDSTSLALLDRCFTDAAISYCKDLYQGYGISAGVRYDEWSKKYADKDNDYIVGGLLAITSADDLLKFINSLEPVTSQYILYKEELATQFRLGNDIKAKQVAIAMNFYRWIHHFNFDRFIVVNIPSASLRYYENGKEILYSKMVVGKPTRRTPRFDATCKEIILYPYWNVPADIAIKELVPKYKKSPSLIDKENMQVLDTKGNIINPYTIAWSQISSNYFPYRLRQSTGCDNSLGVIKFDLTSPFGVYLHDTNTKGLFKSSNRYRSHGCMRVEKAIALGNYLLNQKLDTAFLEACIKEQKPVPLELTKSVPVFVVYLTVDIDEAGLIAFYDDVYHLN